MSADASPEDEFLDNLLGDVGAGPDDEEEAASLAADVEETQEDETEAKPDSPTGEDPAAAEESASPEAEASASEDEPAAAAVPEEPEDALAAEKRRNDALQAELTKLRKRNREMALKPANAPAPAPVQTPPTASPGTVPPAPTIDPATGRVSIQVADDGSSVYVDETALDSRIEQKAAEIIEQRTKLTPEQERERQSAEVMQRFVQEDPENHGAAVREMQNADAFMQETIIPLVQSGVKFNDIPSISQYLRDEGVHEKIGELCPNVAPVLDDLIEATVTQNATAMRLIARQVAASRAGGRQGAVSSEASDPTLESVANAPQSMSRKGGARSAGMSTDEREFATLEKEFQKNPIAFAEAKYDRYQELGRLLGKEGLDA